MQQNENETSDAGIGAIWRPLVSAFGDVLENALDRAVDFADRDEIETINRVRTYVRARMNGEEARVDIDELLFTFTLCMAAFDHDVGRLGGFVTWIQEHGIHIPLITDLERQWIEQIVMTYEALQTRAAFACRDDEATVP